MAAVKHAGNNYNKASSFITFENLNYGIKTLYPSDSNKGQNLSGSSFNNSILIDLVRFSPPFEKNNWTNLQPL